MAKRNETLTLNDLIDLLKEIANEGHGDQPIYSTSDYGDHCHTEQLVPICRVSTIVPDKSAYSVTGLCIRDDEDDAVEAADNTVVVLRFY